MRRSVRDAIVGFTVIGGIVDLLQLPFGSEGFVWGPATGP